MPDLVHHRELDKAELGAIASIFTMFYGISKLIIDITSSNASGKLLLSNRSLMKWNLLYIISLFQ